MIEPRLVTLGDLFSDRAQYQIPIYQRPYVWGREDQWEPLWEDLRETAEAHLAARSAPHFLGAIVIELVGAQPGRVREYSVIDGQQRLTTLQLLLAALRSVIDAGGASELSALLLNDGKHALGDLRLKVLPGEHDRAAFKEVIQGASGSSTANGEGIAGAYEFFAEAIARWVDTAETEDEREEMLDALQESADGLLQLVSIQLDGSSDAQIIFETLNSRGADLTSMDLVKNSLFRLAEKEAATPDEVPQLHAERWLPALGDSDYWLETVRQGRYTSERSDLFLMHWLTMRIGKPARVQHLFADFRKVVLDGEDPPAARELIAELSEDAKIFRSFDDLPEASVEGRFFHRLRLMDTSTLYPVALLLFRSEELGPQSRTRALQALESWLVRRMLLGATTAHYNRLLASLLETLNQQASLQAADEVIVQALRGYSNPTDSWPTDEEILQGLQSRRLYGWINHRRIRLVLEACELQLADSSKSEQLPFPEKLSIEHAMPQNWQAHWPQPAPADDGAALEERKDRIDRIGNLTLVTTGLNSSLSDAPWPTKRASLAKHSQFLVNQHLCAHEVWDDAAIDARSTELARMIIASWPGPSTSLWD